MRLNNYFEEIRWLITILIPAIAGLIIGLLLKIIPQRIVIIVEIILPIIVLSVCWLLFRNVEDDWGPVLMLWPLSGVFVFFICRIFIRNKYPFL